MTETASEPFDHHRGRRPLLRPTHPVRTGVFLAINLAGFTVVCAFWQYLGTGQWVNFSLSAYMASMATPLGETFTGPLSVLTHPWMILVAGLGLGLILMVPIMVAVMYRLVFAGVFVAVVAVIAHTPVLALFLVLACALAARTPLRSDMPFFALLIGLAPLAAYLYVFGVLLPDAPAIRPLQKWVLYAPFLLAGVSAVAGGAVVLLLAKATGFRPGAVWPVLAVLLAAPVGLFYARIGPSELEFGLLRRGLAAGEAIFSPVALDTWKREHHLTDQSDAAVRQEVEYDLETRRSRLLDRCDAHLTAYPDSAHAAEVLWLKAQAMSLRIDPSALRGGNIRYTASQTQPKAAPLWRRLKDEHPQAPQAALADWKLGELALRTGRLAALRAGHQLLRDAAERLREIVPELHREAKEAGGEAIFSPPDRLPDRRYFGQALEDIEKLIWLVEKNRVLEDDTSLPPAERQRIEGTREALRAYLETEPQDYRRLNELHSLYFETYLGDNLRLAAAPSAIEDLEARTQDLLRVARMREADGSPADAAVAARYELGLLAMRPADLERLSPATRRALRPAEAYFRQVIDAGQLPWTRLAEERLQTLRHAEAGG